VGVGACPGDVGLPLGVGLGDGDGDGGGELEDFAAQLLDNTNCGLVALPFTSAVALSRTAPAVVPKYACVMPCS
jgi:hypothetical protein